jgi:lysophospholipase L1-like esterase
MSLKSFSLVLGAALLTSACSDSTNTSARTIDPTGPITEDRTPRLAERYVAMGTSITMGWASNGVYAATQALSWPELLSFGSARPISLPLIQSPGCTSPYVAPLADGVRLSRESLAGSSVCAPLVAGISLPTQNVGMARAIAVDAVQTTPETAGPGQPWYGRVLPPGMTQLTATLSQNPTIVSVELGGNEVLNATSGLLLPGVTTVPFPFFAQPYTAIVNALAAAGTKAVLVGLPVDGRNLAALRRGAEIWANRDEFAALRVAVSNDCENNQNYINVSLKSLNMAFAGAAAAAANAPAPTFSCADVPGTIDFVLTPSDITTLNQQMAQMSAFIKQQADAHGFAYFSLGVLFDRADLKPAKYSVVNQLTSKLPYGLYTSLDAVHPNPVGHVLLAAAAAKAINATYGNFGGAGVARVTVHEPEASLADRMDEMLLPSEALARAKRIAMANKNLRLSACGGPDGCSIERAMRRR